MLDQYQKRQLSFPEDNLNAFYGICAVVGEIFDTNFVFGLPCDYFERALLWLSGEPNFSRRGAFKYRFNRTQETMIKIPSLSWASWHGKIHNPDPPWCEPYSRDADRFFESSAKFQIESQRYKPRAFHQRSELDCLALDDFRLSLDDDKLVSASLYDILFDIRDNGRENLSSRKSFLCEIHPANPYCGQLPYLQKHDVQVPLNECMYLKLSNAFSRQVDGLYQRKFIFCGGEHRNSERHQEAFNVMLVKDKKW